MVFDPQAEDRFFRRLNPLMHFKEDPASPGAFIVSSVAFKQHKANGGWKNSADWEGLITFQGERALRNSLNPGWGIGAVIHSGILDSGGSVEHDPLSDNEAHSLIMAASAKIAKELARCCAVLELPVDGVKTHSGDL